MCLGPASAPPLNFKSSNCVKNCVLLLFVSCGQVGKGEALAWVLAALTGQRARVGCKMPDMRRDNTATWIAMYRCTKMYSQRSQRSTFDERTPRNDLQERKGPSGTPLQRGTVSVGVAVLKSRSFAVLHRPCSTSPSGTLLKNFHPCPYPVLPALTSYYYTPILSYPIHSAKQQLYFICATGLRKALRFASTSTS